MSHDNYFIVQRSWNQLAYLLAVELSGIVAVVWLKPAGLGSARPAIAVLAAAQTIFLGLDVPGQLGPIIGRRSLGTGRRNWSIHFLLLGHDGSYAYCGAAARIAPTFVRRAVGGA
jgi:hypothetical protein